MSATQEAAATWVGGVRARRWRLIPAVPVAILLTLCLAGLFAPLVAPYSPLAGSLGDKLLPPSWLAGETGSKIWPSGSATAHS